MTVIRINYMASTELFDVRTHYQEFTNLQVSYSNVNGLRITTFSLVYNQKGNSSNTVMIYNTVGISMIR